MNKNMKVLTGVVAGVAGVAGVVAVAKRVVEKEARTKALITSVWNEVIEDVVADLGLAKTPSLVFEKLEGAVGSTEYTYTTQNESMFTKRIIATESSYVVKFDVDATARLISYYQGLALRPLSTGVAKTIIKQIVFHELRHVWQAQTGYIVGTIINSFELNFNQGHGEKDVELDANEYALSKASNKREEAIFALQKIEQEQGGKIVKSVTAAEYQAYARQILKAHWL